MIFVTVGTHEQGMERLFEELDRLILENEIEEEVFGQIGYSKYKPKSFKYREMICYDEMDEYIKSADIIITHGGPGSIFHPLQYGKIPIVVPRNPKFNEHVDDHQILFTKRLEDNNRVIAVYDINNLKYIIKSYNKLVAKCSVVSTNKNKFIEKFEEQIIQLL